MKQEIQKRPNNPYFWVYAILAIVAVYTVSIFSSFLIIDQPPSRYLAVGLGLGYMIYKKLARREGSWQRAIYGGGIVALGFAVLTEVLLLIGWVPTHS